jgi:hypothetical protein
MTHVQVLLGRLLTYVAILDSRAGLRASIQQHPRQRPEEAGAVHLTLLILVKDLCWIFGGENGGFAVAWLGKRGSHGSKEGWNLQNLRSININSCCSWWDGTFLCV